jgi:hypothetical protein
MPIQISTIPIVKTYEDLNQAVENSQGVLTISMKNLREIHGNRRLGPHVGASISMTLKKLGLKHHPNPLTNRENDNVRIYKSGSPVEKIINAVLKPSRGADELIRRVVSPTVVSQTKP